MDIKVPGATCIEFLGQGLLGCKSLPGHFTEMRQDFFTPRGTSTYCCTTTWKDKKHAKAKLRNVLFYSTSMAHKVRKGSNVASPK